MLTLKRSLDDKQKKIWLVFIFWFSRVAKTTEFVMFFIFPPILNLIKYQRIKSSDLAGTSSEDSTLTFIFPIFYRLRDGYSDHQRLIFSRINHTNITTVFWLFHPILSLIYSYKDQQIMTKWIVFLFFYRKEDAGRNFTEFSEQSSDFL